MKKIVLIAAVAFLASCGDSKEKEQELKLESFDEKLAFTLGTMSAKDLMGNQNFDASKLEKALLIEGFNKSYNTTQPECGKSIEGLFGATGTDFNEEFLTEGSECIGQFVGYSLYTQLSGFDKAASIDTALLFLGFQKGIEGSDTTVLSLEEQDLINKEFSEGIQALIDSEMDEQWGENKATSEAFLAENKLKDGVITTPSGLQYKVIKMGNGPKPTMETPVKVHYHGTTIDGEVFDSSVDRNEPYVMRLNQVIPGWTEVLQLMPEGSKFKVFIPQDLAYGKYPQPGGPIKPFSALIFDIEMIEVQ